MKNKLQIFISSTYTDMTLERQAAIEAILETKHIPAGMELFASVNKDQMEVIKSWIDESDAYCLILGGRYGSLNPSYGKSYIELEFEYAREINKPIFALVASEYYIRQKVLSQKIEDKDFTEMENPRLYHDFREKLRSGRIAKEFTSLEDLKIGIIEAILFIEDEYEKAQNQENLKQNPSNELNPSSSGSYSTINPKSDVAFNSGITSKTARPKSARAAAKKSAIPVSHLVRSGNQSISRIWLLKLSKSWHHSVLREGSDAWFHSSNRRGKREEYELFKLVSPGDQILGIRSDTADGITLLNDFIVSQGLHNDEDDEERFDMEVLRQYNPPKPIQHILDEYQNWPGYKLLGKPGLRLFELPSIIHQDILDEIEIDESASKILNAPNRPQPTAPIRPHLLASLRPEGYHKDTEDQLEFKNDIEALASTLALKSIKPPLAVGLFGNWGSGKSFFMEKLEKRIEDYTTEEGDKVADRRYVRHVVPVRFNSWHYSDANLWASLITHIFESLNVYAQKIPSGKEAVKGIYAQLSITTAQIAQTEKLVESSQRDIDLLNNKADAVDEDLKRKKATLGFWKTGDLFRAVLQDPVIQTDFENLKKAFPDQNLIHNLEDIQNDARRIDSVSKQICQAVSLLGQHRKGKWWLVLSLAAFIPLAVFGLAYYYEPLDILIGQALRKYGSAVSASALVLAQIRYLLPYLEKVREIHRRLESIKTTIESRKTAAESDRETEKNRLEQEVAYLASKQQALQNQLGEKKAIKEKLETELSHISDGRILADFLSGKSADDGYLKHLSIISWIRKDFSKLNDLLLQQIEVQQNAATESRTEVPKLQIDRIILYIDDLDRCNEETVVRVLEAIHLLLAFELFVVVVGVDPRWLNNALTVKYSHLFGKNELEAGSLHGKSRPATSYNYLEKIFQIPFALKPINRHGRETLLSYLIKSEMEREAPVSGPAEPLDEDPNTIAADQAYVGDVEGVDSGKRPKAKPMSSRKTPNEAAELPIVPETPVKTLSFTPQELEYMQHLSVLFGESPRTINRFLNIYRIVKAHRSLKLNADATYERDDFVPILFSLSVVVGCSEYAHVFVKELLEADDTQSLDLFLKETKFTQEFLEHIQPCLDQELRAMPVASFKKNVELISRFSFRTILSEVEA